jgi:hypothetical protein
VLLYIFHVYRLSHTEEYENEEGIQCIFRSKQRWWYRLIQVCRLWRNLILSSPSQLNLNLVCTYGVPVADMLAHSPPLPLSICYHKIEQELTAEDKSGILLALSHRDRLRQINLCMPTSDLKMLNGVINKDSEFPILEVIHIDSQTKHVAFSMPTTFQAPKLRLFILRTAVSLPLRPPLLTTATGLVTLFLSNIQESSYFPPNYLLTWLSFMPRLEVLIIDFLSPLPNPHSASGAQSLQTLNVMPVTLTYLRRFVFIGTATYLERLIARINAPFLSILFIYLIDNQPLSFTIPHLLQFMQSSQNLKFSAVRLDFNDLFFQVRADPWTGKLKGPLALGIKCEHLIQQVEFAVQILNTLAPALSVVKQVTLSHGHIRALHVVDRLAWRDLLRLFSNVKILHVQDKLVTGVSRSLRSEGEEQPLELLPNLEKVGYSGGKDARDAFAALLDERGVLAGLPLSLRLVHPSRF